MVTVDMTPLRSPHTTPDPTRPLPFPSGHSLRSLPQGRKEGGYDRRHEVVKGMLWAKDRVTVRSLLPSVPCRYALFPLLTVVPLWSLSTFLSLRPAGGRRSRYTVRAHFTLVTHARSVGSAACGTREVNGDRSVGTREPRTQGKELMNGGFYYGFYGSLFTS